MPAVQQHGLDFEDWIKNTFFDSFVQTSPTHKWDALNVAFKSEFAEFTGIFNGLPVSIKTCKYSTPIGFGDAIRQYENIQDFLLFVGFWTKSGSAKKFVAVKAVKVSAAAWSELFDGFTQDDLSIEKAVEKENVKTQIYHLDNTIKTTPFYKDARALAQKEKKDLPQMEIVLNPKIDSKTQRRLQCSLPFSTFWSKFAREAPSKTDNCKLWGQDVPLLK